MEESLKVWGNERWEREKERERREEEKPNTGRRSVVFRPSELEKFASRNDDEVTHLESLLERQTCDWFSLANEESSVNAYLAFAIFQWIPLHQKSASTADPKSGCDSVQQLTQGRRRRWFHRLLSLVQHISQDVHEAETEEGRVRQNKKGVRYMISKDLKRSSHLTQAAAG